MTSIVRELISKRSYTVLGPILLVLALLVALASYVASPFDPIELHFNARLEPPNSVHWFGTDQFGRDVFSRILHATGVSMFAGFASVSIALVVGTSIGSVAGYVGGAVDRFIMTIMDALLALPGLLLALGIVSVMGAGIVGVMLALGVAYTPSVARLVRGTVLSIREKEYVEASRVMGNSGFYTVVRHIVPNCISSLSILATSFFALAILSESALSFLGLGVPPPLPSLGGLLADARSYFAIAPWLALYPGVAITLLLLGVNLSGDALRDWADPRMNGR